MGTEVHLRLRRRSLEGHNVCHSKKLPTSSFAQISTSWGQSAGAISVSLHMLANGGNNEGLFRAGFLESGAPGPYGDILELQDTYDQIVTDAGCASANNTLQCLRTVPASVLKAAMDKSPSFVDYVVRVPLAVTAYTQELTNSLASKYSLECSCGRSLHKGASATLTPEGTRCEDSDRNRCGV